MDKCEDCHKNLDSQDSNEIWENNKSILLCNSCCEKHMEKWNPSKLIKLISEKTNKLGWNELDIALIILRKSLLKRMPKKLPSFKKWAKDKYPRGTIHWNDIEKLIEQYKKEFGEQYKELEESGYSTKRFKEIGRIFK